MKKLIALAMVCSFALAFVACGGGSSETKTEETTTPPADTTTAPADTTAAADTTKTNP